MASPVAVRWQAVAVVMAAAVAVVAGLELADGQASDLTIAFDPTFVKDMINRKEVLEVGSPEGGAERMIELNSAALTTDATQTIDKTDSADSTEVPEPTQTLEEPETNRDMDEVNKLVDLLNQTSRVNLTKIAKFVHLLNQTSHVNLTEVANLLNLVNKTTHVNLTKVHTVVYYADKASKVKITYNATGSNTTSSNSTSTWPGANYTGCTNKPSWVNLVTGQSYYFTSPGFPKQYIPWFSDCRLKIKANKTTDELHLQCYTKTMVWFSSFRYTNTKTNKTVRDDCCIFCGGDKPFNATIGNQTEIFFNNGLFSAAGYNCSIKAVGPSDPTPPKPTTPPAPASCECGAYTKPKVVGGTETKPLAYGWMATLEHKNNSFHRCGASLITPTWVLTAAHCTQGLNTSQYQLRFGVHNRTAAESTQVKRNILQVVQHPKYDIPVNSTDYDYALIRIAAVNLTANPHIKLVCLASGNDTYAGQNATLSGWGMTSYPSSATEKLMEAVVNVKTNAYCSHQYAVLNRTVTNQMMCANTAASDACRGDSGGPLFLKGTAATQIGIVSWGYPCGFDAYPGVYARVTAQREWIDGIVKQKCTPVK